MKYGDKNGIILLTIVVSIFVGSIWSSWRKMAIDPPPRPITISDKCAMNALDDYVHIQKMMLDEENQLLMNNLSTVELTKRKRRAVEGYCTEDTRCLLMDIKPEDKLSASSSFFDSCLKDEEKDYGDDKDNP